ncbi:MAG TPA: hypothetical protein VFX21_01660, partial [Acidimicrobiia bacterium]|nr:hypothetical protein [Acidimicrobiia bacterium]
LESIAIADDTLSLVTGPATVTQLDAKTLDVAGSIDLGVAGAIDTTVAASGTDLYAVTQTPSEWVVTLLRNSAVERRATVAGSDAPVAVAADDAHLWIVTATSVTTLSTTALDDPATISAPRDATPLHSAAAANGAVWFTGGNAHDLYALHANDAVPTVIPLVERTGTADRIPVSVVAGRDAVFALVQASDDPQQHDVVIAKIVPASEKVTHRVALPSDLFVGAIAVS